nr:MAG TPA: hypothetical protein [Caudoviricetes sp.]
MYILKSSKIHPPINIINTIYILETLKKYTV